MCILSCSYCLLYQFFFFLNADLNNSYIVTLCVYIYIYIYTVALESL